MENREFSRGVRCRVGALELRGGSWMDTKGFKMKAKLWPDLAKGIGWEDMGDRGTA